MATKKSEAHSNISPTMSDVPQEPPKDFEKGGRPEIDGWYKNEVGSVVHGQIVAHMTVEGKNGLRDCLLVELHSPCIGYVAGDKEGKPLTPGQVLALTISFDIREALDYVESKGMVWLKPTEKKQLQGGNSIWKFDQYYKGRKVPFKGGAKASSGDDDDIPF